MPSISLVTISKDGGKRLERLLDWAKPHFDEILVFIDETTTDDSRETVRESGATLFEVYFPGYQDKILGEVHDSVKTDWGLHLDDDELMGINFEKFIREIISNPDLDVIHTPRYNLCKPGYYMKDPHRYPDWQLRLFRKGHISHPGIIHEGAVPIGNVAYSPETHIFHFSMMDYTLAARQEKWDRYVRNGVVEVCRKRGLPDDWFRPWCMWEEYPYVETTCEEDCSVWLAASS